MKMMQTTNMNNYIFAEEDSNNEKKLLPLDKQLGAKTLLLQYRFIQEENGQVKSEKWERGEMWNWFNLIFCSLLMLLSFFFHALKKPFPWDYMYRTIGPN